MDDYEKRNAQEWDMNSKSQNTKKQKQSEAPTRQSNNARNTSQQQTAPPQASSKPIVQQQKRHVDHNKALMRPAAPRGRRTAPHALPNSAWLVAEGVKRQQQSNREPQPLLVDNGDSVANAAEAAWRNRKPPLANISVPGELIWCDQQHEAIAKKYGTFVFSDDGAGKSGMLKLDIWGEPEAVKHTRQAIHDWIRREEPSKRVLGQNTFSSQKSLLPTQRMGEVKKWHLEVMRQRFRREPPTGMAFGAIGTFHWPVKEYQPHEVLGNSYEALDPIRMDCSCYVIYNQNISGFQVLGKADAVGNALLRIRKACFQITARQIAPLRRYFLQFRETAGEVPSHVMLESYERIKRIGPAATTSQDHPGHSPQGETEVDLEFMQQQQIYDMSIKDAKIAGKTIMLMIAKLHYYRGHLKFRVRLGTFLATHYRATDDGKYPVDDFKEMLQQSQFAGEVTPELGDKYSETTSLQTLRSADDLLDPRNSMDCTLNNVKPIYTAIFTFADKVGDLFLEVSWHEVEDTPGSDKSELVELSRTWTRLDRGAASPSSLIDISLLNLKNKSAWNFELTSSQAVENNRLGQEYHNIAGSIRIDAQMARQQRTTTYPPFVRWNPYAPVKMLQQRTSWLFALKNSNYTLELSRFQDRVYTRRTHSIGEPDCQVYEPRWSLEVYHSMWDTLLTRNEHLAIGAQVDWDDGVKTWFPEDDDLDDLAQVKGERGFEQLVEKLNLVEKAVLRSESEMFGGMEIG